jgi:hypothetical protein
MTIAGTGMTKNNASLFMSFTIIHWKKIAELEAGIQKKGGDDQDGTSAEKTSLSTEKKAG